MLDIGNAFVAALIAVLLIGVAIGAALFLGLPWLFHHLTIISWK